MNQAPATLSFSGSGSSVSETAQVYPFGSALGTLSATDPNLLDTFTYALTSNVGGFFFLSGASVWLAVAPNYVVNSTLSFTAMVTDNGVPPLSKSQAFTVTVQPVNQPPTGMGINATTYSSGGLPAVRVSARVGDALDLEAATT